MMDGGINSVNSESIENIEADLVWSEVETEDYEIYFSSLRNGQWSPKTKLSNHRAMDLLPSVGSGIDGTIWVVWFAAHGSISDLYYSMFDGENWSIPEMISTGFSSNTAPFVVVDNNNVPWIVWAGFDGEDDDIYFTRWNGFGWDSPSMVNMDNTTPDIIPVIKIGQNNLPWVKWSGYDGKEYKSYISRWTGSKWSEELIEDIENINQSLMGISGHLIPDLPEFVGNKKLATIHVKSNGEGSTFRIREALEESEDDNNLDILSKQTEIQSDEKTIIGYGDSITQGIPYVAEAGAGRRIGGYEPDLEAITQGFGWNTEVLNYGFGGESSAGGLSRLGNQTLGKHNAKYVLILEGTNDLIYYGISVDSTLYFLGQMIDKSRAFNVIPVIATLTPDTKSPKNNIPTDYNPRIKDLAFRKNCALADQYAATISNWPSLTDDGLHPNRAGYRVMAQAWYDALPELTVVTLDASEIDRTSVVMNGRIGLKGYSTNYSFEFGETPDLGSQTNMSTSLRGDIAVFFWYDPEMYVFASNSYSISSLISSNRFCAKITSSAVGCIMLSISSILSFTIPIILAPLFFNNDITCTMLVFHRKIPYFDVFT